VEGRPGWHIECSAMSEKHLGEVFDIHGGGVDLKFPHHENEIAQSCCAHGTDKMASVWMHNGFLMVEGEKMSKSLGNFITVHDLLETDKFGGRKWPGEVIRLAMLMTHYRDEIDFSVARLEEAESLLDYFYRMIGEKPLPPMQKENLSQPVNLSIDLNTTDTVWLLKSLFSDLNNDRELHGHNIRFIADILGILKYETAGKWFSSKLDVNLNWDEIQFKIDHRITTLKAADTAKLSGDKNLMKAKFTEADRIRDELLAQGIQLKDGKDPETGERITTWEVAR
jgi:cysteinyl-tRNA synthetase